MTSTPPPATIETLAREIRADLSDRDVLDALAHELAASRLQVADLRQQLQAMQDQLQTVVLAQQLRDILLPQARQDYAGRRQLVIEAGMPLAPDQGFHGLETDGVGNAFRWTGPTVDFHFDAHLDRSAPLRFVLQLPLWGAEHAQGLRASCDGVGLVLRRQQGNRVLEFEGMLLPREVLGLTRLSFASARLTSAPLDEPPGAMRRIGVPFLRLSLQPASLEEFERWRQALEPAAGAASAPERAPATVSTPVSAPVAPAAVDLPTSDEE